MFPFNLICIGLSIAALGGWIWYQSYRIENLETKNSQLNQELNIAVTTNTELIQNLDVMNKEYSKQLDILNTTLDKKEEVKTEIDRLKRKVNNEDQSIIVTANDILSRMQQQARDNNKSKN